MGIDPYFINAAYRKKDVLSKLRNAFKSNQELPSVVLDEVLERKFYATVKNKILKTTFRHEQHPLTHSYSTAQLPPSLQEFMRSKEFAELVSIITNVKLNNFTKAAPALYQFTWKDYTLLHDSIKLKPGLDIILDFSDPWQEEWGGSLVYVDGTGDYTRIMPKGNRLVLVGRDSKIQRFVQYVNHQGKGRGRILLVVTIP